MLRRNVAAELAAIQAKHRGVLRPVDVVEFARNPKSALHARFEWDDTKAAEAHRIEQARGIIRLHVTIVGESKQTIRTLVSLSTDRKSTGGGYRAMVDILKNDGRTQQMIADALAELLRVKRKYETVKQLRPIWNAMAEVEKELPKPARRAA